MMPKRYSQDQIKEAVQMVSSGVSMLGVSNELGISSATIHRWVSQSRNKSPKVVGKKVAVIRKKAKQVAADSSYTNMKIESLESELRDFYLKRAVELVREKLVANL